MRTALSAGPGYQFIDKGDLASPYFKEMTMYSDLGLSYFNEDFRLAPDQSSTRLRWAVKWNWPILADRLRVFYDHEMFPSLENAKNFYYTSNSGLVLTIVKNFITKVQVTYRYNNTPPAGTQPSDTIYVLSFGYGFGK
jgi:putative salt-induced outer membrane protein YdiY